MRIFIFVLLYCLFSQIETKKNNTLSEDSDSLIFWKPNSILKFKQFQAKKPASNREIAHINCILHFTIKTSGNYHSWVTRAAFIPNQSFMLPNDTLYSLSHEKIHLDITQLYNFKLIEYFKDLWIHNDSQNDSRNYVAKVNSELKFMQVLFDKDTRHGNDTLCQKYWEQMIQNQIERQLKLNQGKY